MPHGSFDNRPWLMAVMDCLLTWKLCVDDSIPLGFWISPHQDSVTVNMQCGDNHESFLIPMDLEIGAITPLMDGALADLLSRPTEPDDDADTYAPTDPHIVLLRAIDAWTPPHGIRVDIVLDTASKLIRVGLRAPLACGMVPIPPCIDPACLPDILAENADTVLRVSAQKGAFVAMMEVSENEALHEAAAPAETGSLAKAWETFQDKLRPHGLDA